jgi:hypothetical protein
MIHLQQFTVVQITYELTQKDFTESYVAHRNRSALKKWSRQIFLWILCLFTAFILFGFLVKPSAEAARNLMPFFMVVFLWLGILWALPRWNMRRQFSKQPGAHGPRTVLLDASGVHWRWNGGSSDVEWKNYIQWTEGKNQFLFYTSPACFNILPKRTLGPEQLSEIREVLKQNIQVTE